MSNRGEFESRNPVPSDAKWSEKKRGYYWLQHPGVAHPFDNDWMIWQEACEWQADHGRRVDAGPASGIEQRLREAHPISHQKASGSNILLEAADEIQRLQSELTAARDEAERLRGRVSELESSLAEVLGNYEDSMDYPLVQRARKALPGSAGEPEEPNG